jgi:hypothetical protein
MKRLMPFTLAHPAAAVPLRRLSTRPLLSALVVEASFRISPTSCRLE